MWDIMYGMDNGRNVIGKIFFFKQKTAYEVLRSLVGSEMCIRDRVWNVFLLAREFLPL